MFKDGQWGSYIFFSDEPSEFYSWQQINFKVIHWSLILLFLVFLRLSLDHIDEENNKTS